MSGKTAAQSASLATGGADHKYLTFLLEGRSWGMPVGRIQEIIRPMEVLPLPETPHYVEGVINLRKSVIPLVNLRTRLGHPTVEPTERTAVIIVRTGGVDNPGLAGLLVDAVEQVLHLGPDAVEQSPAVNSGGGCIAAIAHIGEDVMTLLDLDEACGGAGVACAPVPAPVADAAAAAAAPVAAGGGDAEMDWFDLGSS